MGKAIIQKQGKSKRGRWTQAQREYVEKCLADGCIACLRSGRGATQAQWHHEKQRFHGAAMRAPHEFGLPLCDMHHKVGLDSIHRDRAAFEKLVGCTEAQLVDMLQKRYNWK